MAETVLDSLVVRIRADLGQLEQGLREADRGIGALGQSALAAGRLARGIGSEGLAASGEMERGATLAARRMTDAFARMARQGEISFNGLKNAALAALAEIAAAYVQSGLEAIMGGGGRPAFSTIFLPQRAGGGAVARGQAYLVGERGPEIFVPAAAGRIAARGEARPGGADRVPRISITINQAAGGDQAMATRRSAAQLAVALRRAMMRAERAL